MQALAALLAAVLLLLAVLLVLQLVSTLQQVEQVLQSEARQELEKAQVRVRELESDLVLAQARLQVAVSVQRKEY